MRIVRKYIFIILVSTKYVNKLVIKILTIVTLFYIWVSMALKRKVRKIGNSLALAIPNEIFDFFDLNPENIKYKLCQDDSGSVFILILNKDVVMLDEKNFHRQANSYTIIIPKTLCNMWNIGLSENQNRELELRYDMSPLKWKLSPV